ncbi:MAG: hypothetical protein IID32_04990, partial [Planctomycetes bacterium]|nr:hypothetical protein [Planctomycetota bacterium]
MTSSRMLYKLVAWVCIGLCSTTALNADDEITALLIEQVLDDPDPAAGEVEADAGNVGGLELSHAPVLHVVGGCVDADQVDGVQAGEAAQSVEGGVDGGVGD